MKTLPLAMICFLSACTGVIGGSPGEAGDGADWGQGAFPIDSGTNDGGSPDAHAGTSLESGAAHDAATHDAAGGGGDDGGEDGGAPLIPAPLTGNVSPGTWQYIDVASPGFPQGTMHAGLLLPSGYATSYRYPVIVYEHQNSEGDAWYQQGGDPTQNTIVNQDVIDGFFNSVAYRTDHPSIVVVPFCDQTIDPSGSNGDSNFGGYADSPGSSHNENGVVAVVQYVEAMFSAYPARTYVTGQSLGGIGAWALLLDHNQLHGALSRTFTAGAPLSGGLTRSSLMSTSGSVPSARFIAIAICARPQALAISSTRPSTTSTSTSSAFSLPNSSPSSRIRRSMVSKSSRLVIPVFSQTNHPMRKRRATGLVPVPARRSIHAVDGCGP